MLDAPLQGIRVLDLSRLLPGPYCTLLLAQLGAEVIKIEPPSAGEYVRAISERFGGAALFATLNRGKKSVALNFRHAAGRRVLLRLIEGADVLVETYRPGAMRRWKLGYEEVRAANPRLIYCSLSGYGQEGPFRDRAGHDLNYLAVGGLLALNGAAAGPPIPPGVQIADLAGGTMAALAVMAGVVERSRTGEGSHLDVSMLDAVLSWMAPVVSALRVAGQGAQPLRGRTPLAGALPCYNVYETADGKYVALAALEPHFWAAFCTTVGRPDLLTAQFEGRAIADVAALFRARSRADWVERFSTVDACLEPVYEGDEMLESAPIRRRGLASTAEGGLVAPLPFVAARPMPAPAAAGAHTGEVLRQAGVSEAEIDALAANGVIVLA